MVQVPESVDSVATMYPSSSIVQFVYLLTNPENRDAILKKSNVIYPTRSIASGSKATADGCGEEPALTILSLGPTGYAVPLSLGLRMRCILPASSTKLYVILRDKVVYSTNSTTSLAECPRCFFYKEIASHSAKPLSIAS
jgi:hypothetical protein